MKPFHRLFVLHFVSAFLLSICVFTSTSIQPLAKSIPSNEPASLKSENPYEGMREFEIKDIESALALGIIPKGMSFKGDVTAEEWINLLRNCITMRSGNEDTLLSHAINLDAKTVWRQDASLALFYAAKAMGIEKSNSEECLHATDNSDGIQWDSHLFSNWQEYIPCNEGGKTINYPKIMWAAIFTMSQQSPINGTKLMEVDQNNHFNFQANMTRKDAILAAYRLYSFKEKAPKYISFNDIGPLNISKELLVKNSTLPELTSAKIPCYKGFYITNKTSVIWDGGIERSRHFNEDSVRFLSENGFNFLRISFSFSSLGYPDYPDDNKVNENELEELDELITWGIKYNVHMSLAMCGLPGYKPVKTDDYPSAFQAANQMDMKTSQVFHNPNMQKEVLKYWAMLAKRYGDVPSKFLSFQLIVEPDPPSDKIYTDVFGPVVEAIRKTNKNRVIFAYANMFGKPFEGMAKLGCPVIWSFYKPNFINYYGSDGDEIKRLYPFLEYPKWPMLYLPATFDGADKFRRELIIKGNFEKGTVSVYVDKTYYGKEATLNITGDNQMLMSKKIHVTGKENNPERPQEDYIANILPGTKKLIISVGTNDTLQYNRIQITQNGKDTINLYPHDIWGWDLNAHMPTLLIDDKGAVSVAGDDFKVDFDYLYNWDLKDKRDMANKYGVGFMLSEWGPFAHIPDKTRYAFMEMALQGFQDYDIPWCYFNLTRQDCLLVSKYQPPTDFDNHEKYKPLEYSHHYYVNTELLKLYQKYMNVLK